MKKWEFEHGEIKEVTKNSDTFYTISQKFTNVIQLKESGFIIAYNVKRNELCIYNDKLEIIGIYNNPDLDKEMIKYTFGKLSFITFNYGYDIFILYEGKVIIIRLRLPEDELRMGSGPYFMKIYQISENEFVFETLFRGLTYESGVCAFFKMNMNDFKPKYISFGNGNIRCTSELYAPKYLKRNRRFAIMKNVIYDLKMEWTYKIPDSWNYFNIKELYSFGDVIIFKEDFGNYYLFINEYYICKYSSEIEHENIIKLVQESVNTNKLIINNKLYVWRTGEEPIVVEIGELSK